MTSYSFPTDAKDGDTVTLKNGIEYIFQEDKDRWMVNSSKDGLAGHFVKKQGGDSMEGPLVMLIKDGDARASKRIETYGVFSNSDGSALRLGTTRDRVYIGHNDTSFNGPIKVAEIQEKNLDGGIEFADRVILKTEGAEENEAVTKKYIDEKSDYLQNEIIELEEEIEAIAPSVERGRWSFTAIGTVAQPGQFTMYDADFGNGSPTGLFKSAKSIWFNELDLDGVPHSFANVKDGELLEIFIDGSPEYGLFSVVGDAHDETQTGTKFWVIDVDFVRTNEATTAVAPSEICRFKIFNAPSGGDATSFVMKSGDTMSGNLNIDISDESDAAEATLALTGNRDNTTNSAATIAFENSQSLSLGYLTYRSFNNTSYFKFNQDLKLNNKGLIDVDHIELKPGGSIGSSTNKRLTFHNASSGNEGEGLLVVPRPADNRRGFSIRGNDASGNEKDMLFSFTNTGKPDAVNYEGKMDSGTNLVNKAYVDSKYQSSSNSPVMLHSGWEKTYSYVPLKSLSDYEMATGSASTSTDTIYLFKAFRMNWGGWQVLDCDRTDNSMIEIWEYRSGSPILILKAGIKDISVSPESRYDSKITLDRFWAMPSHNFMSSRKYSFILHGLADKPAESRTVQTEKPADELIDKVTDESSEVGE